MNFLTDELRYVIRKVYMANEANAQELCRLARQEGRGGDYDYATMLTAKAQGLWYANATLQCELADAGLIDILDGVKEE